MGAWTKQRPSSFVNMIINSDPTHPKAKKKEEPLRGRDSKQGSPFFSWSWIYFQGVAGFICRAAHRPFDGDGHQSMAINLHFESHNGNGWVKNGCKWV